jgi:ankyrin repeat protein
MVSRENSEVHYDSAIANGDIRKLRALRRMGHRPPQASILYAVIKGHPEILSILKEAGADPNETDGLGETALARAISKGSPDIVEALLKLGADPNKKFIFYPLDQAVLDGRCDLVDLLLKYEANPKAQDKRGQTALLTAVRGGDSNIVHSLLEAGADPWHEGPDGLNSFALAEKEGKAEILDLLRRPTKGKPASPKRKKNLTELLISALKAKDKVEVQRCLVSGADVNKRHKLGWSPLEKAIETADAWFVRRLLKAGADPNDTHPQGSPPIVTAVTIGNAEIVRALLRGGAKVRTGNWDALAEACAREEPDIAQILLDAGADPNGSPKSGVTSLMFAASRKLPGLVQTLLKNGARVDAVDPQGATALFHAVQAEMVTTSILQYPAGSISMSAETQSGAHDPILNKVIQLLVEHGANVNHKNKEGRSTLTFATSLETARLLLAAGAHLSLKDHEGRDASYWLKRNRVPISAITGVIKQSSNKNRNYLKLADRRTLKRKRS